MTRLSAAWVALVLVGVAAAQPPAAPGVPDADLKSVVDGNNAFALDLYRGVSERAGGNVVLSPYSVASALAMTTAGARGKTAEEMAAALHVTLPPERFHPAQAALARALQTSGGGAAELRVANALWRQRGFAVRDDFLRLTRDHYGAGLREVDFVADPERARQAINAWVGEETRGKIPNLLTGRDVSADTRLVLTNAVYFKAAWHTSFPKDLTADDTFRVTPNRTVPVRMMNGTVFCRGREVGGVKVVALPYRGAGQSMVLVVPNNPDGLAAVERALSPDALRVWFAAGLCEARLALPVFRARERLPLGGVLGEMGMRLPFGIDPDFGGVAEADRLQLEAVVHEATIEVDETGAEAAAATAVVTRRPISAVKQPSRPPALVVRADRPFLYLIRDNPTGAVLFVGRVTNP
ncbi:serpin family protein [bacterium]|nr:serpin family protein [bacterium]